MDNRLLEEVESNLHLYLLKLAQGEGLQIPWLYGGNSQKIVKEICQLLESKPDEGGCPLREAMGKGKRMETKEPY